MPTRPAEHGEGRSRRRGTVVVSSPGTPPRAPTPPRLHAQVHKPTSTLVSRLLLLESVGKSKLQSNPPIAVRIKLKAFSDRSRRFEGWGSAPSPWLRFDPGPPPVRPPRAPALHTMAFPFMKSWPAKDLAWLEEGGARRSAIARPSEATRKFCKPFMVVRNSFAPPSGDRPRMFMHLATRSLAVCSSETVLDSQCSCLKFITRIVLTASHP
jgi:hypothetical protein